MNKWKNTLIATIAAVGFAGNASANLVDFDITINFGGGLSVAQQAIFGQAENFWETNLIGYADAISFPPGLTISATGEAIDGVGGVLGSAGPSSGYYNTAGNTLLYSSTGSMRFDTADLASMESNGSLLSIIIHEMGHVVGFGTLWSLNNLYSNGTGLYTGAEALAAYQAEFDAGATHVPVELDGGPGTEDGHWDETWAGPQSDIMTGYYEGPTTFSDTTYAAFRDLGYATLNNTVSPAPNPSDLPLAFFSVLSILGLVSIRRKSKETI